MKNHHSYLKLWLLVSDANYAMHNNKNYYENIKNNFKESLEPFFSLIEMVPILLKYL